MKKPLKKTFYLILLVTFILVTGFLLRQSILKEIGSFLSPSGTEKADALIIEGDKTVDKVAVREAIKFLSNGRAKKIMLVVHQCTEEEEIFGIPNDYKSLIFKELELIGLNKDQFQVLSVPVQDPVTLMEAKYVLTELSKINIRSTIVMANGFHTRRTFLSYRYVGTTLNIVIIPVPYFKGYTVDNWWQKTEGFRSFFSESFKLFYYVVRGYIPVSFLFANAT